MTTYTKAFVAAVIGGLLGLAALPVFAAQVGVDDDFWGESVGVVANYDITGPRPPSFPDCGGQPLTGSLNAAVVQAWLDNPLENYGVGLIPQAPNYGGNTILPSTEVSWKHMTVSMIFDDFTTADVNINPSGQAALIRYEEPDYNLHADGVTSSQGGTTDWLTPANGGPHPVLYEWDLSTHAGKTLLAGMDPTLSVTPNWSECGKCFDLYHLPDAWDQETVTYNNLVWGGEPPPTPYDLQVTDDAAILAGPQGDPDTNYNAGFTDDGHGCYTDGPANGALIFQFDNTAVEGLDADGDGTFGFRVYYSHPSVPLELYELAGGTFDEATVTWNSYVPAGGTTDDIIGELVSALPAGSSGNPLEFPVPEATVQKILDGEVTGFLVRHSNFCASLKEAPDPWPTPALHFNASTGGPMDGDVNEDGFVGGDDLDIVLGGWGMDLCERTAGDLSGDCFIGGDDLDEVLANWGEGTPPTAVPEPASLLLLAGGIALLRRKSR